MRADRWLVLGSLTILVGCTGRFDVADAAVAGVDRTALAESPEARAVVDDVRSRFRVSAEPPLVPMAPNSIKGSTMAVVDSAVVDGFTRDADGIHAELAAAASRGVVHRVELTLPENAQQPFHLRDSDSSLAIDVSLDEISDAPAESGSGYLVYRGQGRGPDLIHRVTGEGTEDYVHFAQRPARTQLTYRVRLSDGVRGLRLVDRVLEFLDEQGTPRLRMARPYAMDANGRRVEIGVAIVGCSIDTDARLPYGRAVVAPGASACDVVLTWDDKQMSYPVLVDPVWSATGCLTVPRYFHTATVVSNGNVLIAGGYTTGSSTLYSTEWFSPSSNTFAAGLPMNNPRGGHTATLMNDGQSVLIAGGAYQNNTVEYWSPLYSSWTVLSNHMQSVRIMHSAVMLTDGSILICGGTDANNNYLSTCDKVTAGLLGWVLNPAASMYEKRQFFTLNMKTYQTGLHSFTNEATAVGGYNGTTTANGWENYYPGDATHSDSWTDNTASELSPGRSRHASIVLNSNLWAFGGYTASSQFTATVGELVLGAPDTWSSRTAIGQARSNFGLVQLPSGKLALVGGYANFLASNYVDIYDITGNGSTTAGPTLLTARYGHATTLLQDGRVLVTGGYNTAYLTSVELLFGLNGETCTANAGCQSGFCVNGVCCNSSCSCGACNNAGFLGTCRSPVAAGSAGSPSCSPYVCDGSNTACPGTCTTTCASGYECARDPVATTGVCIPLLGQGGSCYDSGDCQSGYYCVNNICCASSSCGSCQRCDVPGHEGSCFTAPRRTISTSCAPYTCDGSSTGCPMTCTIDQSGIANCAAGFGCVSGSCVALLPPNSSCTQNSQCASGFCAGVCCDSACNGSDGSGDACSTCINTNPPGTCQSVTIGNCAPFKSDPKDVRTSIDRTTPTTFYASNSFLYTGTNPIQTGAVEDTSQNCTGTGICPARAAIVRGRVLTSLGAPFAGATITVFNHPEFGSTTSRGDGYYDLMVNGGGTLVLTFSAYLSPTVQRQVRVPWRDWVVAPTVVLKTIESTEPIQLSSPNYQSMQGALHTDGGSRQATLIFAANTTATAIGSNPPILSGTIHVNATELTTAPTSLPALLPLSMPGDLPPTTAFTYAADFSVAEAQQPGVTVTEVDFSPAVISYVDNFLNIPVAQPVPAAYYDSNVTASWVALPSGLVVNIVGAANGMVNMNIDGATDGSGNLVADSDSVLNAYGITPGERSTLYTLYGSNPKSLWRVLLPHFCPVDYNYTSTGVPPLALDEPGGGGMGGGSGGGVGGGGGPGGPGPDDGECTDGSIIECLGQSLGERIPIVGTPYGLAYRSDRAFGYQSARTITIPVTGSSLPSNIDLITVDVSVAGRTFSSSDPNSTLTVPKPYTTGQSVQFTFDGYDAYGRRLQGAQRASVRVTYLYTGATYQPTPNFGDNNVSGATLYSVPTRMEAVAWQTWSIALGNYDAVAQGLGGWDIDIHHFYDPTTNILYYGDGRRRTGAQSPKIVQWVAGNGTASPSTDGLATTHATYAPHSAVAAPDGSVYFIDSASRVRQLENGNLTTVAGGGPNQITDGAAATSVILTPQAIALAKDGSLYIADGSYRVFTVAGGVLHFFAGYTNPSTGQGVSGDAGDNGPRLQAQFVSLSGIAVANDGTVYVADQGANRVRRIATSGNIYAYAGTGQTPMPPLDYRAAATATLWQPADLAVGPDDTLYIMDTQNQLIRHVTASGIINTVAGGGSGTTDGIQATASAIGFPFAMTVGPDGAIYIAQGYTVRRVGSDGVIVTVAGQLNASTANWAGDNGPATAAQFGRVEGIAVAPQANPAQDQVLYLTDYLENCVRKVSFSLASTTKIISDDGREIYEFDSTGRHWHTYDALVGNIHYTFDYDGQGRLWHITDFSSGPSSIGNKTTINQNASPVTINSYYGLSTQLGFDMNGYLASITDPLMATVSLNNSPDGLLVGLVDARNNEHKFEYDTSGYLKRDANPAGGAKSAVRTPGSGSNYSVAITTPMGVNTAYSVQNNADGSQTRATITSGGSANLQSTHQIFPNGTESITASDLSTETRSFAPVSVCQSGGGCPLSPPQYLVGERIVGTRTRTTPGGTSFSQSRSRTITLGNASDVTSLISQVDVLAFNGSSNVFTTTFNRSNLTSVTTTPTGRQIVRAYDSRGRLSSVTVGNLAPLNYVYDDTVTGLLSSINIGGNRTIQIGYDALGQTHTITGPSPLSTQYGFPTYDADGRVKQITLPDTTAIVLAYDANGNLDSVTPPGRPAHSLNFTAINQLEDYVPPDIGIGTTLTKYGYNADRIRSSLTLPDNSQITYVFDGIDRLSSMTYPRGTQQRSYNTSNGQISNITTPDGVGLNFVFDGNLLTNYVWTGPVQGTIAFTYNNLWSVGAVQITDAVQTWSPVQVLYDADRLLECAGAANTASCTNPTAATIILTRDPSSGLITGTSTTSNGNAVTDARTISSFGEVTEYQAGTTVSNNLMDLQYAPTIGGTLMSRDALGRLTAKRETFPDGTNYYTYLYDPNGRLTDVYANGATQSTHYDYGVNATRSGYTAPGGSKVVPVYDNQDRMTQYGSKVFTYGPNGERRTTTINNATTSYNYDALGNLLAVALPNGPAITYVVDGLNRRIGKQVGGVLTTGFLYDSQSRIVAQLDGQNHLVNQFVYASDEHVPDYFINVTSGTPNVYRILKDQLGSPRVVYSVTNSSLGIVQRMDFDEFGNVTQDTKPGFQPFGFAGGIYDADTKLVRFGVRDYDPSVGVWLSKDPSGFAGGDPNLYAYSGNDPINRTDPSGLDDTVDFAEQCFQEADSWPPQLKWIPLVAGGVLLAAALFKVQCTATCNVQDIGGGNCPDRVTGWGTGPNQNGACKAAKRDANLWVPSGCYKRHCQCDCN